VQSCRIPIICQKLPSRFRLSVHYLQQYNKPSLFAVYNTEQVTPVVVRLFMIVVYDDTSVILTIANEPTNEKNSISPKSPC